MSINKILLISLLQITQVAFAQQAEVIPDAKVTKRVLRLQADVTDVNSSAVVVVSDIRLVDDSNPKMVSYFTAKPTRDSLNLDTGEHLLIENTSEYICMTLGYGRTVPESRKKDEKKYLMQGEFIASSLDGESLILQDASGSWDLALGSISCQKLK